MMSVLHGRVPLNVSWMFTMALLFSGLSMSAQGYADTSTDSDALATKATDDVAQRIRELRDTDPAAAISMAEPLLESAQGAARFAIGSELVEAYLKAKRIGDAKSLVSKFETDSTLDNDGRAKVLHLQLMVATAAHVDLEIDRLAYRVPAVSTAATNRVTRAELLMQLGQARLVQSRFADSASAFEQALEAVGQNDSQLRFEILQKVGVAYAQLRRYPESIESFSEAEKVNARLAHGDDATFLLRFRGVFLYTGDSTRAIS